MGFIRTLLRGGRPIWTVGLPLFTLIFFPFYWFVVCPFIWHRWRQAAIFNRAWDSPWFYGYWSVSAGVWVVVLFATVYCWKRDNLFNSEDESNVSEPLLPYQGSKMTKKLYHVVPLHVQPKGEEWIRPLQHRIAGIDVRCSRVQPLPSRCLPASRASENEFVWDDANMPWMAKSTETLNSPCDENTNAENTPYQELENDLNPSIPEERVSSLAHTADIETLPVRVQPLPPKFFPPSRPSENEFTWDHENMPWSTSAETSFFSICETTIHAQDEQLANSLENSPSHKFDVEVELSNLELRNEITEEPVCSDDCEEGVTPEDENSHFLGIEYRADYYQLTPVGSLSSSSSIEEPSLVLENSRID